jgi:urease accessory protein
MALVGTFALFHGHAHGSEGAGLGVAFVHYAIGFIMATIILHVVGIICGLASAKRGPRMQKIFNNVAGTIGIVAGISLLAGWLAA